MLMGFMSGRKTFHLKPHGKYSDRNKIIGVSTHDLQQARAAEHDGADYVGFGPMYGTTTKATGYTARGLDQLREIRAMVRLPIVAIGGLRPNVPSRLSLPVQMQ